MSARRSKGALALLLHTHMPYVEGYGTWPFGEEWLWEAMATSYLPLLDVLEGSPVTLTLTPVLADQLSAPGIGERFVAFLRDVRSETHRQDIAGCRAGGREDLASELECAGRDYERALEQFIALGGDLLGALGPHVGWTSSATHAVLPLLATDAGVRLQAQGGINSHRARFGAWDGGFWLPECAHAPWLDALLEEAGVHACCVDLTDVFGPGAAQHLRPLRSGDGPLLVPLDRQTMELAWSDDGYPAAAGYRDYHRHTVHHHRPWANDGSVYDRELALGLALDHATDFVARTIERLEKAGAELGAPALSVCALDTELLGHWWYEGVDWLRFVIDQAQLQGLRLVKLDESLADCDSAPAPVDLPTTTWGRPRTLATWDGPAAADFAWRARDAELRVVTRARSESPGVSARAVRELLALQSSDWAFMVSRDLAVSYGNERAAGHAEQLRQALAAIDSGQDQAGPRHLSPDCAPALLGVP